MPNDVFIFLSMEKMEIQFARDVQRLKVGVKIIHAQQLISSHVSK